MTIRAKRATIKLWPYSDRTRFPATTFQYPAIYSWDIQHHCAKWRNLWKPVNTLFSARDYMFDSQNRFNLRQIVNNANCYTAGTVETRDDQRRTLVHSRFNFNLVSTHQSIPIGGKMSKEWAYQISIWQLIRPLLAGGVAIVAPDLRGVTIVTISLICRSIDQCLVSIALTEFG